MYTRETIRKFSCKIRLVNTKHFASAMRRLSLQVVCGAFTINMIRTQSLPSVQAIRENKAQALVMIKQVSWTLKEKGRFSVSTERPDGIEEEGMSSGKKQKYTFGWRTGVRERGWAGKTRRDWRAGFRGPEFLTAECRLYMCWTFQQVKKPPEGILLQGYSSDSGARAEWKHGDTEDGGSVC